MESVELNVCQMTVDDIFLEGNGLFPEVVEHVVNECPMKDVQDDYNISLRFTELSTDIVSGHCDDSDVSVNVAKSHLCAEVYLQIVGAMELPVDDGCRVRRRLTRRGSKRVSAFIFLWMVVTVVMLSTCDTGVTSYTAYVFLPEMDVVLELVGLRANVHVFDWCFVSVQVELYTDTLRKFVGDTRNCFHKLLVWMGELQRCFLNVVNRQFRLNLFIDLVCRFTFGD
jgi:hypothetical protein